MVHFDARMLYRTFTGAVLFATLALTSATAQTGEQSASAVLAAASKAMGADNLTSITYSGTARIGQWGQGKAFANPMGAVNLTHITAYTRTLTLVPRADPTSLVSRATGPAMPPTIPGMAPPTVGVFNQNISGTQLANDWPLALNVWATPWGFLKGAAANNATARREGGQQVVSFSPATPRSPSGLQYTVTGYIDDRNLVTKVETKVEDSVVGDLLAEFEYTNYRNMNGLQIPTRIVQKRATRPHFDAVITAATANPSNLTELLTPPPAPAGGRVFQNPRARGPGAGGPPATPPAPERQMLGPGVFKITSVNTSLAIDMGDYILMVESPQSDERGRALMDAAKQAIPGKPIRYVVNSHPHFDHSGGLAAAIAEGAIILTHRNNKAELERLLSGPRTLIGDSLSKVTNRRTNVVEAVGDRDIRKGTNGKVVELIHVPNEHSDGMLIVYLPAEKVIWSADMSVVNPNALQTQIVKLAYAQITRMHLDFDTWIMMHTPNPDRRLTKADVIATTQLPKVPWTYCWTEALAYLYAAQCAPAPPVGP